jgi:hypothetical protein
MYYRGADLDPTFPPPNPPKPIFIASEKPPTPGKATAPMMMPQQGVPDHGTASFVASTAAAPVPTAPVVVDAKEQQQAAPSFMLISDAESRARLLEEVKEHLELLKQFDGIIPEEEISQRKRELFLALPLPPPPAAKREKKDPSTASEFLTI